MKIASSILQCLVDATDVVIEIGGHGIIMSEIVDMPSATSCIWPNVEGFVFGIVREPLFWGDVRIANERINRTVCLVAAALDLFALRGANPCCRQYSGSKCLGEQLVLPKIPATTIGRIDWIVAIP